MITRENYEIWMIDYLDGALDAAGVEEMEAFLAVNPDIREEIEGLGEVQLQAPEVKMDNKSSLLKTALPCSPEQLDHRLVALLEGDLDPDEKQETLSWISDNAEVAKIWALVQKSQLTTTAASFKGKSDILIAETVDLSRADHRLVALVEGDLSAKEEQKVKDEIAGSQELATAYNLLKATIVPADQSLVYPNKGELYKTAVVPLYAYVRYAVAAAAAVLLGVFAWSNFSSDQGARFANNKINSHGREILERSTPVNLVSQEAVDAHESEVSAPSHFEIVEPVVRNAVYMEGMNTRFASNVASKDEFPEMQGSIKSVNFATYAEESNEILFADNTIGEKVGGLAGVLVNKTAAIMPQALALTETPAAENAKKMWNDYRDQKTGGVQVDKVEDIASNERVLFSLGKLRVSKKH